MGITTRFRRAFFKQAIEEKVENISNNLLEAHLEQIEYTIRKSFYDLTNDESYHNNYLREILPLVTRTDNRLQEDKADIEKMKEDCSNLCHGLEKLKAKKKEFEKLFAYIASSRNANDYVLYKNNTTNELMLINGRQNVENNSLSIYQYPAVVCIDLFTNEISQKYLFDDLWSDPRYPKNVSELLKEYLSAGTNLSFDSKKDIEKAKQMIMDSMNDTAEQYETLFQKKQEEMGELTENYRTRSVLDTAIMAVGKARKEGSRDIDYYPQTKQVNIRHNNNALVLNYCDEGVTSAYFMTMYGKTFKVYDIKETMRGNKGFLSLSDSNYRYLINDAFTKKLFSFEGLGIDNQERVAETDFKYIGKRKYDMKEVGVTEPDNPRFWFGCDSEEEQTRRLELMYEKVCVLEQMYKVAGISVCIDYNPYNNTINIENNDIELILAYGKDPAGTADIYYKPAFAYNHMTDIVLVDGQVRNEEIFVSSNFSLLFDVVKEKVPMKEADLKENTVVTPPVKKEKKANKKDEFLRW